MASFVFYNADGGKYDAEHLIAHNASKIMACDYKLMISSEDSIDVYGLEMNPFNVDGELEPWVMPDIFIALLMTSGPKANVQLTGPSTYTRTFYLEPGRNGGQTITPR